MSDNTVIRPIEVPGMKITFQSPIGPQGKMIAFDVAADATIGIEDLNDVLDTVAKATRRQDAFEQLRLDQQSLRANRKYLIEVTRDREDLIESKRKMLAVIAAKREVPVAVPNRRVQRQVLHTAPEDISQLAGFDRDIAKKDDRLLEIQGQLAGCLERIPLWKRTLAGDEPQDLDDLDEKPKSAIAAE